MSLRKGANTILSQCLNVQKQEQVVVLNDSNDQNLINSLIDVLEEASHNFELVEFEEPEEHGDEPPEFIAEKMKESDVFVAPTTKSLSHTDARREACKNGARGATLPGINEQIWRNALQADYRRVEEISEQVYRMLEDTDTIRVQTPSGTDLTFEVDFSTFEKDTGIIHNPGDFGNLPAGEADGASVGANGVLVVDHIPYFNEVEGAKLEIEDNEVVGVDNGKLEDKLDSIEGARNVAEFGFGTNPEARLIGNILQDEKVLGTVHVALGDNSSYIPDGDERKVSCPIHWDIVCENPTVHFDDKLMLDEGEPVFLD